MLVGEHLPTGDMASLGSRLFSVNITPPSPSTPPSTFLWQHLAQRINAGPWEHAPAPVLGELLVHQLNREDQRIAALLACVRHSLSQHDLSQWSADFKHTDPKEKKATALSSSLSSSPLNTSTFQHHLKASPLKPLIRRSLLPQQLLSVLALPPEQRPTNPDDWVHYRFSFYDCAAAMLAAHLPPLLLSKTHEFLSQQYLAQRKIPMEHRVLPVANSVLVQEARYHEEQAQQARLRFTQQKTLQQISSASPTQPTDEMPIFSEADLQEIAHHQERLSQSAHESAITHPQPTIIVMSPTEGDAPLSPSMNIASPHSTPISEPSSALFHTKLQPALSYVTSAQQAFSQQQWAISQADLEAALQQLKQVEVQSQQLQAVVHSRLAYVAAINQQWETTLSHYQHAQQYLNKRSENDTPPLWPWLVAQQCLTETLLPERYQPTATETLCQRLLLALHTCEEETTTAPNDENDPFDSFWQAVLPMAPLLAELTFRAASLLDTSRRTLETLPNSPTAEHLYELAYTRLLETNQPFAAASAAANRAALLAETKTYDQAIPWLQRALNLEEANGWIDEAAESHQRLAKAYAKTQQWQSALHHGDCVLRWLESEENATSQAATLARWQQRLGQWAKTGGFPNQAKVYWLKALETLYGMSRVSSLTPQQQAQQHELETAIRQEA
jgi:tetratricopeptide (TPR) repeat protein